MSLSDKMIDQMMKKAFGGGNIPDLGQMMGGYEFKDGMLKASIEYTLSEGELDIQNGRVVLYSDRKYSASVLNIGTTLRLKIIPPTIAFVYIPYPIIYPKNEFNILFPNVEKWIDFSCYSSQSSSFVRNEIKKGTEIGYGFFIPFTSINSVNFINKNANTP
jgi:hypothetical protein